MYYKYFYYFSLIPFPLFNYSFKLYPTFLSEKKVYLQEFDVFFNFMTLLLRKLLTKQL